MKKSTLSTLALSLVLGLGGATFASADNLDIQGNGREFKGSQATHGQRGNDVVFASNGAYDGRGSRGPKGGSWNSRANDFEGTWRLESRGGAVGNRNNGHPGQMQRNDRGARLPEVIRIENNRGAIRVEAANGQLLRQAQVGRNGGNDGQFVIVTETRGARVTESYSLQNRGLELVVKTTVQGPHGSREHMKVYNRA